MNSLITVIVPVYNVEPFLPRCLESILIQSYNNLEILVIDDGSTDGSGMICDRFAKRDSRIQVIHKANGGLSSARNMGLDNAHGQYISFIDSDDFIAPDFYERLLHLIVKNDADIAFCNYSLYYSSDFQVNGQKKGKYVLYNSKREIMNNFYNHNCGLAVIACNKLYKIKLFEQLRFPEGRLYEDEATTYIAFYNSIRVAYLKESLYFYYQRLDSITHKKLAPNNISVFIPLHEVINFYLLHDDKRFANKAKIRLLKICAIYVFRAKKENNLKFWSPPREGIPKLFADEYQKNLLKFEMMHIKFIFDIYGIAKNIKS